MKIKEPAASYVIHRKKYTYQDYLDLPDDGNRYELINGELVMTPAPNTIHQTVTNNFEDSLRSFLRKNKMGKMFHAPYDVVLSKKNVVQPDILYVSAERSGIITESNVAGVPDLIIEILSPGTAYYDLLEKKEIYEQFGVPEYWIVDPKKLRIDVYQNVGQRFELNQRVESEGIAKSIVIKGFEVKIENIFSLE
ncbi:MAG: Uma2 family endonuclease [bacterium]|jgi:Uma2 family endonuclease|nr:Uma2 family endonuclease [bacterium]